MVIQAAVRLFKLNAAGRGPAGSIDELSDGGQIGAVWKIHGNQSRSSTKAVIAFALLERERGCNSANLGLATLPG